MEVSIFSERRKNNFARSSEILLDQKYYKLLLKYIDLRDKKSKKCESFFAYVANTFHLEQNREFRAQTAREYKNSIE